MALSTFAVGDIFARAVRALFDRSGEHRGWYLARNIMNAVGMSPSTFGYSSDMALHNAVWSVVRQAQAAQQSGSLITENQTVTPTPPKIPGISLDQPEYRYRVIVEVTDPSGRRARTAVDVRDDNVLTYGEVRERAAEIVANMTPREGETPGRRRIHQMTDYTVTQAIIVMAGRRG